VRGTNNPNEHSGNYCIRAIQAIHIKINKVTIGACTNSRLFVFVFSCSDRHFVTGRSHAEGVITKAYKQVKESIRYEQLRRSGQLRHTDRQVGRGTDTLKDEQIDRQMGRLVNPWVAMYIYIQIITQVRTNEYKWRNGG
jgi:hypothetical protein